MKTNLNKFTDEKIYEILYEYFTTEISNPELMKKSNFGGPNSIYRWMKKLGINKQDMMRLRAGSDSLSEEGLSAHELELERENRMLREELERERLKTTALSTMIDIVEKDLKIDVRKKRGAKQ